MTFESQRTLSATPTIPDVIPVLPVRGIIAFPSIAMPLLIRQPSSIRLVDDVMRSHRLIFLVAQRNEGIEQPKFEDLYQIGTVAVINRLTRGPDGVVRLFIQGIEKARLVELISKDPYFTARIEPLTEETVSSLEVEAKRRALLSLLRQFIGLVDDFSEDLLTNIESLTDIYQLIYLSALAVPISMAARQEILEIDSLNKKLERLIDASQHELAIRELGRKIIKETEGRINKSQRDYFLREQVRSIQKELGEEGGEQSISAELRRRIEEAHLPDEAKKEAERELNRLATTPINSPEYGIIRTYVEWMAGLPWNKLTGETIDIRYAKQVLDEDHYDLNKIKDRILEYLAVKRLRQERQAVAQSLQDNQEKSLGNGERSPQGEHKVNTTTREPILCFVGPPGVGKTSLGQSIARALGRQFTRLSLGGVHDEAEIRGHRRTYIGAMPGKIIQGIKRAETRDPVFMLDEIDKVRGDWRGDPASALLEVLDPAQNQTFVDNYLGVAFDLSQVLFIATANTLDTIPGPLLDRMEVLHLSGYTDEEKVHIAQRYLIPKELNAHGLLLQELSFSASSIRYIIRSYTREAGVRNLDREIASVCRKVARDLAEGHQEPIQVTTPEQINHYLGKPHFFDEVAERTERPGVATGLAWTPVGGDILFVEATMMPSPNEGLILTGMLGDVMKESAQAALSYIKSNLQFLQVDPKIFERKTIHLHVPAGAIPKDGPSAGVTMVTAIASLATSRPVQGSIAMTGEVTLRGKVLPVGGIKEKVLAAHRAGIKTVILPAHNEKDLEEILPELKNEIKFLFVNTIEEVLSHALTQNQVQKEGLFDLTKEPGLTEWNNRTEQ